MIDNICEVQKVSRNCYFKLIEDETDTRYVPVRNDGMHVQCLVLNGKFNGNMVHFPCKMLVEVKGYIQ